VLGQPLLRWKAASITHSECVFGDFSIQHATHMPHIVVYGLPGSTIFFHITFQNGTIFEKIIIEHEMCASIFSTDFI
jgi:hypothetical protein